MNCSVRSRLKYSEVAGIVVPRTPVLVMNLFVFSERSSKDLFHDDSVFKPLFPVHRNQPVSGGGIASLPVGCAERTGISVETPASVVHMTPASSGARSVTLADFAKFHNGTSLAHIAVRVKDL